MKLNNTPEAIAEKLLGRPFDQLDEDEQHVLRHVLSRDISLEDDETQAAKAGFGDRLADRVAKVGGSWGFIIWFMVTLLGWMLLNSPLVSGWMRQWDAYPYIFLNLMLSMLAAVQAPVIMMSQNRQSARDRIYNRHDYEINLRTTIEIVRLHRKIDRLTGKVDRLMHPGEHKKGVKE